MNIFSINDLNFSYGDKRVLSNISTSIKKGEFLSIIGPNGAGKSTLIKILSTTLDYKTGEVKFLNKELKTYDRTTIAKKISLVQQRSENMVPFNVLDYIKLGLYPHKEFWQSANSEDIKRIKSIIELTGIKKLENRIITQLSGGEMQLVSIARALVQNMETIILDEPISNLDLHHQTEIMDLLYDLNKKGSTIITVLHDINRALTYSSRILAIKDGELFMDGKPEECISAKSMKDLYKINCYIEKNSITGKMGITPLPGFIENKEDK